MSILDGILGGNGLLGGLSGSGESENASSTSFGTDIATNPSLGLHLQDLLDFNSSSEDDGDSSETSFTGLGDLGLAVSAPTHIGLDYQNEQYSQTDGEGGGLLGGLL